MKSLVISLCLFATLATAQDYYFVSDGPTNGLYGVRCINWRDRDGDRRDYLATGLMPPCSFPALVDSRTGYQTSATNITEAVRNLCNRAVSLAYDASTNYTASVIKVTGGGKALKDFRKSAKKNKESDAIDTLTARIEMLEALLRQRGIMTPGAAMQENP